MKELWYLLKGFFYKKICKHIKIILISVCIVWIGWSYAGVNRFMYKHLFGKPATQTFSVWTKPKIQDVTDPDPNQVYNIRGHKIRKKLRKHFALSAMSVYRDDNTEFWKWYFDNAGNDGGRVYNQVAAFDLSLAFGKTANKSNIQKIKISHELNLLHYQCESADCHYDNNEISNLHIIPASRSIYYGIKAIPQTARVPVYVEGYLMDWQSVEYPHIKMETALFPGQISKQKAGGKRTVFCFQLYLTKLIYDGYVFE